VAQVLLALPASKVVSGKEWGQNGMPTPLPHHSSSSLLSLPSPGASDHAHVPDWLYKMRLR